MRIARFTVDDNLHFGLVEGEPGSETLTVLSGDPFYTGVNPTDKRRDLVARYWSYRLFLPA